ncbi:hypothetical protein [Actinomyces viscosus]|uniref:hypothetical protein n=1 Tax=Actinomyces viscosus TaxID=1656 RepID=UPI0028EAC27B|nr:hypothetical protein [Actinomyces viscosus]
MKHPQSPRPRPLHQLAASGVATAAVLGPLGASASTVAAPTTVAGATTLAPGASPIAVSAAAPKPSRRRRAPP